MSKEGGVPVPCVKFRFPKNKKIAFENHFFSINTDLWSKLRCYYQYKDFIPKDNKKIHI